ncbi:hypothetical protein C4K11_4676 [Pseudomonas chlororaphis subsp. aureofaciens]|nr:hypothetical protein C4K14_5173 [Pseudomonas chlororaphis subsp. aureofaciens]AZD94398.1 hypothetical protein C4K13_5003 [Pseudomonas chlororaphis subsp. aureofaciens]AZE00703.1 hypothetical protein C4K12_4858 [Pseudomonas chlororaphis subsp. aureofaciens]AZE06816.1 hypothetical protein C4K11_4676 [Pseudomonas chlororaphis subsp. aureofaciens]
MPWRTPLVKFAVGSAGASCRSKGDAQFLLAMNSKTRGMPGCPRHR